MKAKKIRRLVTGHDENGKSIFVLDGIAESVLTVEPMGGLTATYLWETYEAPADNTGARDNAERPVHLEPGAMGSIFRVVEFPPDSVWKDNADAGAAFDALQAGHAADQTSGDASMHKTNRVDYALVIEGEIWAVMDTEERRMQQGDVLIQRGTNHGWSNKSDKNYRVMFVLCGADPL
jgi:mannose-6-phosphate isomerase-like protein (cupin superfamily)